MVAVVGVGLATGLAATPASAGTTTTTHTYTGAPVAVPDGNAAGVDVPIVVPAGHGTIASMTVTFNDLATTFAADLDATLVSPAARTRILTTDNGASGNNFLNTVFDDAAAAPITGVTNVNAPFTGTFRPEESLSTTAGVDFRGEQSAGTWKLHAVDDTSVDAMTVQTWSMKLTTNNLSQTALSSCVKAPKKLKRNRTVALTKKNCKTNAGQLISVSAKKSKAYKITKKKGVWRITTKNKKVKKLKLKWSAAAPAYYDPFSFVKTVKLG